MTVSVYFFSISHINEKMEENMMVTWKTKKSKGEAER